MLCVSLKHKVSRLICPCDIDLVIWCVNTMKHHLTILFFVILHSSELITIDKEVGKNSITFLTLIEIYFGKLIGFFLMRETGCCFVGGLKNSFDASQSSFWDSAFWDSAVWLSAFWHSAV